MNHHWLEKQKLRANRARFREAGHQRESPSEYVIRKMELLMLVYSYTDTEMIQAIMMEVPGTWALRVPNLLGIRLFALLHGPKFGHD